MVLRKGFDVVGDRETEGRYFQTCNLRNRTFYDLYSMSLQLFNICTRMNIARGFSARSLWPVIIVSFIRDFSYATMNYRFKSSFAYCIWTLRSARRRGLTGLARVLQSRKLKVRSLELDDSLVEVYPNYLEEDMLERLQSAESKESKDLLRDRSAGSKDVPAVPNIVSTVSTIARARNLRSLTPLNLRIIKNTNEENVMQGVTNSTKRKLLFSKYTVDWAPKMFRVFEPLRVVYPLNVIDDGMDMRPESYFEQSDVIYNDEGDDNRAVPVGPRVPTFYTRQYLECEPAVSRKQRSAAPKKRNTVEQAATADKKKTKKDRNSFWMGTTRHSRAGNTIDKEQTRVLEDGTVAHRINLNSVTNVAVQMVAFNLFKIENLPAIAGIDEEAGEESYERIARAYRSMTEAGKTFVGADANVAVANQNVNLNLVWGKFFTDALIGLDWNENGTTDYDCGRATPQLREQFIRGAPSVLSEDYEKDEADTPFGHVSAATLAMLSPLYVNIQSYALKNFALRTAAKLQTVAFFFMFRIVLPFFVLSASDDDAETTITEEKKGRGRIFVTPRRCRTDSADANVACPVEAFIEHNFKQTLFVFALVFVDVSEIFSVMRAWNGVGNAFNRAHPMILKAHARFLNNICARFGYGFIAVHIAIRAWSTLRDCFQIVFGEFNECYCKGEDREASYCYKYNQENKNKEARLQ